MACSCQKKSIGMARRKSTKNLTALLTRVAAGAGGYIAGDLLNNISFVQQNPNLSGWIKTGAGVAVAFTQKGMLQDFGIGMAVAGAGQVAKELMPSQTTVSGIPAPASTAVHSVSGYQYNGSPFAAMR